jgi:CO/xanthine dehydrogenase FAD-binding subunit/aerobic-type carbon monoxide dehydrogenase small subunit (CoxS/CutS family)
MKPPPFDYHAASSVAEVVALLDRYGGEARVLAGGQSLMPLVSMRLLRPAALIDINDVSALDGIREEDGHVRIGALTRYSALEASPVVRRHLPLLAEAVRYVGDRQIRNRGTLGGALVQADPTGEMPLAAVTLGATVTVQGPEGQRRLRADEIFLGPYATAIGDQELLLEVSIPDAADKPWAFLEYARRHGDFAVIAVAVVGARGESGRWDGIRLALGGVGPHPYVDREASALLNGSGLEQTVIDEAVAICRRNADPPSDVRASAEYRRALVPIYVQAALEALRNGGPDRYGEPVRRRNAGVVARRAGAKGQEADGGVRECRVRVSVNGQVHERLVEARRLLVDFIRRDLGLHGTHVGCEQGVCGACTVLLDGEPVKSCLLLAAQAHGRSLTTVESLGLDGGWHPLQEAFAAAHALQCGYCTPGFLMLALALGERGEALSEQAVREELAGTLCRCTGYQAIVDAVAAYVGERARADE